LPPITPPTVSLPAPPVMVFAPPASLMLSLPSSPRMVSPWAAMPVMVSSPTLPSA